MSFWKQALMMTGAVVVPACVGYPISLRLWGSEAVPALGWAAAGCLFAGLTGLIPPVLAARMGQLSWLPQAAMGGMVLRILLTGTFMFLVTETGILAYGPFTAWLITFYMTLLAVETIIVASYAKHFSGPTGQHEGRPA